MHALDRRQAEAFGQGRKDEAAAVPVQPGLVRVFEIEVDANVGQPASRDQSLHMVGVEAAGTGQHQTLFWPRGGQVEQGDDVLRRRHAADVQQERRVTDSGHGFLRCHRQVCGTDVDSADRHAWREFALDVASHVMRDGNGAIAVRQAPLQLAAVAFDLRRCLAVQEVQIGHGFDASLGEQRRPQPVVLVQGVPQREARRAHMQPALRRVRVEVAHLVAEQAVPALWQVQMQLPAVLLAQPWRLLRQCRGELARDLSQAVAPVLDAAQAEADVNRHSGALGREHR